VLDYQYLSIDSNSKKFATPPSIPIDWSKKKFATPTNRPQTAKTCNAHNFHANKIRFGNIDHFNQNKEERYSPTRENAIVVTRKIAIVEQEKNAIVDVKEERYSRVKRTL